MTDAPSNQPPREDPLERLEADIDEARERIEQRSDEGRVDQGERSFSEEGGAGAEDNTTIVPPG